MRRPYLRTHLGPILLLTNILVLIYSLQPLLIILSKSKHILFVEKDCSYCTVTTREIIQKNYQRKFRITTIDISESKFYEDYYHSKINECSVSDQQKGVPMLYSKQKCFVGAKSTLQELERLSVIN